jgi:ATP-binding cassette subfamily B protein
VNTDTVAGANKRGNPFSHVAAAGWGRGLGTLVRITRLNLRHPWQVTVCLISTLIASALMLWIPRLLGQAIDQARGVMTGGEAGETALWTTAVILLVVSILRGLFTLVQNYYSESVGHHAAYELRLAAYEKVQRLSYSYHDGVHSGDLIMLGIIDIDGVRMFFATGLVRLVLLTVLIGVGAYLLLTTDLLLGLLSLSFVPFVAWRSSVAQLTLRETWLTLQERLAKLSRVMEENLGGTRVVRAFAAGWHELVKFDQASKHALELAHERVKIRVDSTSAMNFSFFVSMGLVLWFGGLKVNAGEISVGTLASFLTFMTILQMPVRQLGLLVNSFARASTCGSRLFALLDLELEIKDKPGAQPIKITDGTLRFENVSFAYPSAPTARC